MGGATVTDQLTLVKALDGVMFVDKVDYSTNSTVRKLGGKHMQYRLDDWHN